MTPTTLPRRKGDPPHHYRICEVEVGTGEGILASVGRRFASRQEAEEEADKWRKGFPEFAFRVFPSSEDGKYPHFTPSPTTSDTTDETPHHFPRTLPRKGASGSLPEE